MAEPLARIVGLGVALGAAFGAPASAQVPIGDFYFFDRSGVDGNRSSVTTLADENFVTGAGGLTWACEESRLGVTLSTTYLGRSFRARARWAFDGEEFSDTQAWILLTSGMAVRAPADLVEPFTRRALESGRVVLQVTDYQFRRHSWAFGLEGLREALDRLPCGLPEP
jgi:hypothetical protein